MASIGLLVNLRCPNGLFVKARRGCSMMSLVSYNADPIVYAGYTDPAKLLDIKGMDPLSWYIKLCSIPYPAPHFSSRWSGTRLATANRVIIHLLLRTLSFSSRVIES